MSFILSTMENNEGMLRKKCIRIRFTLHKIFLCSEMEMKNAAIPKQVDAKKVWGYFSSPSIQRAWLYCWYQHRTEHIN